MTQLNRAMLPLALFALLIALFGCGEDEITNDETTGLQAFIVNGVSSTLSVYDVETGVVTPDVVQLGKWPADIQVHDGIAYVVNTGDNSVQMIDLDQQADVGLINVGDGTAPEKIAFFGSDKAYVTSNWTDSVKVIDLVAKEVVNSIQVGAMPWGVAVSGDRVFVCNTAAVWNPDTNATEYGPGTVTVIDANRDEVLGTIDVGLNSTDVVIDGDGNAVVLCTGNYADVMGALYVIDRDGNVLANVDLGVTPNGVAIAPNGRVYVSSWGGLLAYEGTSLSAVHDAGAPLADFPGGAGMAFDADGNGYIAAPSWNFTDLTDKLYIMDANEQLIKTVELGKEAGASMIVLK